MSEAIKKHQFAATRIQFEDVTTPSVCENPQNKWAEWGEDNDYFNYVIRMYNSSVTNAAIINTITTWIEGGGLNASDKDRDIIGYNKFLNKFKEDAIEKFIEDFKLQGNAAFQIIWSKGEPKVAASFYHMPIQYLRPELADENGDINHYYYSENWQELRKKQYKPVPYPVFDGRYKGADLEVLVLKQYKAGLTYFGAPDYISSMRWIEIEGAVSEFHLSNIHNGFAPSVIVSFNNGIPSTQEEIHETETSLKRKFGGEGNAGKFIVTFADSRDQGVEVTTVPTNDLDKQYEFVSSHARQMIITGHKVTSPMLLGIKEDTGLGNNADEIKNATLLFQSTVIQGFQKQILKAINILAKAENANFDFYFIPYTPIQFQVDEVKQVEQPTKMSTDIPEFTKEIEQAWIEKLSNVGEVMGDDWELASDEEASDLETEKSLNSILKVSLSASPEGYDNASKKSELDDKLYRVRYAYSKNLSKDSREFCKTMVGLSKGGTVYRIEDIDAMSSAGVNGEFAASGSSTYDIFKFKGGCFCHHFWRRLIFYKKGVDVSRQKAVVGVVKEGIERKPTKDMPNRGSLKYS